MDSLKDHINNLMDQGNLTKQYHTILKEVVFKDPDVRAFLQKHQDELDEEAIMKSAGKLYEFVNEKAKSYDDEEAVVKGHYPKLVLFNKRIHVEYVPTESEIRRQKTLEAKNRMKSFYISKEVKEANFDDLIYTMEKAEAIKATIDFIDQYEKRPNEYHKGLYIQGSFGVGKTYLLGALAKKMSEAGYEVTLVHFPTFTVEIKAAIQDNTVMDKVNAFKETEILIIDDIGAESMTAWLRDDVLGVILQYRMQHNLSTFFTSNMSMKQLEEEHLTHASGNEPVKAARIMERIKYLANEIEITGQNFRHN